MELATLEIKLTAQDAIRQASAFTVELQKNESAAEQAEQAQTGLGHAFARVAAAEREAYREAQRMTGVQREAARAVTAYQQQVVLAEQHTRRLAAAEREAYREAAKLRQEQESLGVAGMAAGRAMTYLGAALTAPAILRGAVMLGQVADSAKLVRARLDLVTEGSAALDRVQAQLLASAQRTRTAYEDQATLYARVARNADELGVSERKLLTFTELVSMQLQIAGSSASEASSGVQQLSQALGKGKLDGDEFRTIMEAMPTVADAMAKSLGVPKAALFALSAEGKLTARTIIDAMLAAETQTRTSFASMAPTLAQGWTQARNVIVKGIGDIDAAIGASTFLSKLIAGAPAAAGRALFGVGGMEALRGLGSGVDMDGPPDVTFTTPAARSRAAIVIDGIKQERDARRTAWEEARRLADERAQWEEEAITRATRLAAARFAAEHPDGPRAPGAQADRLGLSGAEFGTIGRGVRSLPESMRTGPGLSVGQARAQAEAARILKAEEAMAKASEQITENFLLRMQGNFAGFFRGVGSEGRGAMRGILSDFRDAALDTFAELASRRLMQGLFGGGKDGGLGALGGVLGGPAGFALGLGALALGGIFGGSRSRPSPRDEFGFTEAERRDPANQARIRSRMDELARLRTAGFDDVGEGANQRRQSVAGLLTQTSAARMLGVLESIRIGIYTLVEQGRSGGGGGGVAQESSPAAAALSSLVSGLDAAMGVRSQALRLAAGVGTVR